MRGSGTLLDRFGRVGHGGGIGVRSTDNVRIG
jgi:hypothetical protein